MSQTALENRLGVLKSKQNQFLDVDLTFKRNQITNDVRVKSDAAAINQSLKNLILTNHFERPFDPEFGGNIWEMIFEPLDSFSVINIEDRIQRAIKIKEPRVENLRIKIRPLREENTVIIKIYYTVPRSDAEQTTQFSIERVR